MSTFPHAINADNMGSLDFNLHTLITSKSTLSSLVWIESESHSVLSELLRPHGRYNPWNSPGQNTGVGSHSLLQGIFPTQGSNPGLSCCRHSYQLSHQGSPRILEWVAYPFSRGSSLVQELNQGLLNCRFFISWATREAPWYGISESLGLSQDSHQLKVSNEATCIVEIKHGSITSNFAWH